MKGGRFRKFIGISLVIFGIMIFFYPIVKQARASKQQELLKEALNDLIVSHQVTSQISNAPEITSPLFTVVPTQQATTQPQQEEINLEEQDTTEDTQTAENVKNRLNGQTLVGLIEIPKIDLIYAIVEGTSDYNLGVAIGHMSQTASVGAVGNCCLAGHRGGTSGPYFKKINQLEPNDEIKITDTYGQLYTYHVTESFVVEPEDMWVTKEEDQQTKLLTLITCQEHGNKRLIVRAVCNEEVGGGK